MEPISPLGGTRLYDPDSLGAACADGSRHRWTAARHWAMTRAFKPFAHWLDSRHRSGFAAELQALAYLVSCGWEIEAHRFRVGRSDVDLVIRRGRLIAFVEVKQRSGPAFGTPQEAVHWRKRLRIQRVASVWIERCGRSGDSYRFDLVSLVRRPGGRWEICHLGDAWRG